MRAPPVRASGHMHQACVLIATLCKPFLRGALLEDSSGESHVRPAGACLAPLPESLIPIT